MGLYDKIFKPKKLVLANGKVVEEKCSRAPLIIILIVIATWISVKVTGFSMTTLVTVSYTHLHLMNGVSHMLPFVIGGGILIAIAFLIDGFAVDLNSLPFDERSNFGTITPMAAMFKSIGGVAFGFMLPILAGFIAMSIADRPGLAVGFIGGAIAANGTSGFLGALVAGFVAGLSLIHI